MPTLPTSLGFLIHLTETNIYIIAEKPLGVSIRGVRFPDGALIPNDSYRKSNSSKYKYGTT